MSLELRDHELHQGLVQQRVRDVAVADGSLQQRLELLAGMRGDDLDPDPIQQFNKWFSAAIKAEIHDANSMTLATCVGDKPFGGSDGTTLVFHDLTTGVFFCESSRNSQLRAIFQSRMTVSGETPRTSAVSSTLRPPK